MITDLQIANSISPSFCAAKWTQVTLHLQSGQTHSCHHPRTHQIPVDLLKQNPSALHNTPYKIQQREQMMQGQRPKECGYCWRVEDLGNAISDRHIKTESFWSQPFIDDIVKDPLNPKFTPKYVEISFGNLCNLKCSYCSPNFSSQWQDEIEKHGGYPTSINFNSFAYSHQKFYRNNEFNPYVDAWWRWYDDLVDDLLVLRVTGGEPFLNKNLQILLEKLLQNPKPHLTLAINSNLCVPDVMNKKIFQLVFQLLENKCIKEFELYTSCEAHGARAEYIRWGLNYETWKQNLLYWGTELKNIKIIVMSTFNLLSLTSYLEFLQDILNLKKSINSSNLLVLDLPYLRNPEHQVAWLATSNYQSYLNDCLDFINQNRAVFPKPGFYQSEKTRFERIISICGKEWEDPYFFEKYQTQRRDFVKFVDEHDRRRGSYFLETFPEMRDFYNSIKEENNNAI
jgi:organic radical activating enzyme